MDRLNVGLVGTGYAAKLRAETISNDERSRLIAVVGHNLERTRQFCEPWNVAALTSWEELVSYPALDLVIISTVNRDHAAIARAALTAGKHVVVEYPLALNRAEADELVKLAEQQNRLLHVEHIELLSGIHEALKTALASIGQPFYVRYTSINPQHPAPQKWTYQQEAFGFPLVGAVSRIHRLTNLFGTVKSVTCQARFFEQAEHPTYFASCLCSAQLCFSSGLVADVLYGKGEQFWHAERDLIVQGEAGAAVIRGDQGTLIQQDSSSALEMGSRRGLFAKDTALVLDHVFDGTPLYVSLKESVYALAVAEACERAAQSGETIYL